MHWEDTGSMHSESRIWFIAGLGLAVLFCGVLARAYLGADSLPAAAVFGPSKELDVVHFSRHEEQLLNQPTILKADAATLPLLGEPIESPLQESLVCPIEPFMQDYEPAKPPRVLMPLGFLREDLPLIPPSNPVQQP
jgi:hypothetical protein